MILGTDYQAAQRRIDFHAALVHARDQAAEMRIKAAADSLARLVDNDTLAWMEASAVVREYERQETDSACARLRAHASIQMMLQPAWAPQ